MGPQSGVRIVAEQRPAGPGCRDRDSGPRADGPSGVPAGRNETVTAAARVGGVMLLAATVGGKVRWCSAMISHT